MSAPLAPEPKMRRQPDGVTCRPVPENDGEGVALALGGGFSRGFAHLGALEVLEQERIPISAIAGTSIGGLLGAAYADGISVQDLCDLGRKVRVRDFIRFQSSDQNGHRIDRIGEFVRDWFQAGNLEDLSIPTAIVTTNLKTGSPYVFTRGPIGVAIRASCAFPGLFEPVTHEGHVLADGCIVSPVPTLVAGRMSGCCVVGVAVASNLKLSPLAAEIENGFNPSGRTTRKPLEPHWSRYADVLVEPEVEDIEWNDFTRVEEARAAGAEAMRQAIPALRSLLDQREQIRRSMSSRLGENRLSL